MDTFKELNYKEKDLIQIISEYNHCKNSQSVVFTNPVSESKEDRINLLVKAGYRLHSLKVIQNFAVGIEEFDDEGSLAVGLEIEYIFNFNKNKWSLIANTTYSDVEFFLPNPNHVLDLGYRFEYTTIDVGIGGRHSMFVDDKTRFFISAGVIVPITLKGDYYVYDVFDTDNTLTTAAGFISGGVNFQNFYAEIGHTFNRIILNGKGSEYSNITLSLGYSFL